MKQGRQSIVQMGKGGGGTKYYNFRRVPRANSIYRYRYMSINCEPKNRQFCMFSTILYVEFNCCITVVEIIWGQNNVCHHNILRGRERLPPFPPPPPRIDASAMKLRL